MNDPKLGRRHNGDVATLSFTMRQHVKDSFTGVIRGNDDVRLSDANHRSNISGDCLHSMMEIKRQFDDLQQNDT